MSFAPKVLKNAPIDEISNWVEKDDKYTWHPFTQHGAEPQAPVIMRGQGASLFDQNDREIIDCISSWWTCTHGHCHPELAQALKDQADTLDHVIFSGFTHPPAIKLAETIINKLPDDLNRKQNVKRSLLLIVDITGKHLVRWPLVKNQAILNRLKI